MKNMVQRRAIQRASQPADERRNAHDQANDKMRESCTQSARIVPFRRPKLRSRVLRNFTWSKFIHRVADKCNENSLRTLPAPRTINILCIKFMRRVQE